MCQANVYGTLFFISNIPKQQLLKHRQSSGTLEHRMS